MSQLEKDPALAVGLAPEETARRDRVLAAEQQADIEARLRQIPHANTGHDLADRMDRELRTAAALAAAIEDRAAAGRRLATQPTAGRGGPEAIRRT